MRAKLTNQMVWVPREQGHWLSPARCVPHWGRIGIQTECVISRVHPEKEGRERYEPITSVHVNYHTAKEVKPMTKADGQKQAFTKALQSFTSLKDLRVVFWKAFAGAIKAHRGLLTKIENQLV